MSFVPHPYERFVDDLLTALTGGMIREEHQFIGVDETYSLAAPGSIPNSLRVFGQRNQAYFSFEYGIDFTYDVSGDAIRWIPDGQLPDDHSYFYVNYYTEESQPQLTDRNPGSVTATLAEAFAREFAVLHKQMDMIYQSAFVDLANGSSLDHIAALLGIARKDARFASGEVLFKRSSPTPADINVPSGTLVSTQVGQNFETIDRRTLRRGQLSVIVPIRAQAEGIAGRAEAGSINIINRPIFGIESVINEAATIFGREKETDEELRRRIKSTLDRAGKSTLDAIKYSLIEDLPEITEENIQVVERAESPGIVEVRLGLGADVKPDVVQRVEESIFYSRPAGIRVIHNLPTETPSAAARQAEAEQARRLQGGASLGDANGNGKKETSWHEMAEHLTLMGAPIAASAQQPEGTDTGPADQAAIPIEAEILLRLKESNLTAAEKDRIEDDIRQAVTDFIEQLPMDAALIYNKLLGLIVQRDEVADGVLLLTVPPGQRVYQSNLNTSGRKAQAKRVSVGLMEETVEVSLRVHLTGPGNSSVTQALRDRIHGAVENTLVAVRGRLLQTDMRTAIENVLKTASVQLTFAQKDPVVLNLLYKESGRLLNNVEEVALEENEVLRLKDGGLEVAIPGALDV
jgi:hypothetical protein